LENLKGRDHSEDVGVDEKIRLELTLRKQGEKMWTGFICLRVIPIAGCREHYNEHSVLLKGTEFLD
jgi:hypothetical protein